MMIIIELLEFQNKIVHLLIFGKKIYQIKAFIIL